MGVQHYRGNALKDLTDEKGVYALCDLDFVPIYVGQSKDGIRTRVRRHLTSARSDVIANRHLDVWEVSQVWAWEVRIDGLNIRNAQDQAAEITALETQLIKKFNDIKPLVNGKLPDFSSLRGNDPRAPDQQINVLEEAVRLSRKEPINRMPRQAAQLRDLIDYTIQVKNNSEQRRVLRVHNSRLREFYETFMRESGETEF